MAGSLFYVIGPSGAGKDSIIEGSLAALPAELPIIRAHRYITRPACAGGENHVELTPDDFIRRRNAGLFLFCWESHGYAYGIGREVVFWLEAGFNVIMNGSRAYLEEAVEKWSELVPILITLDVGVLRSRLEARGRESPDEIESRLERAQAFAVNHPRLMVVENNGPLEDAVNRMCQVLRRAALQEL